MTITIITAILALTAALSICINFVQHNKILYWEERCAEAEEWVDPVSVVRLDRGGRHV